MAKGELIIFLFLVELCSCWDLDGVLPQPQLPRLCRGISHLRGGSS